METAFLTPGGYYARISDPAANQLEVECYSFEDDDPTIDSSTMPFFFRHWAALKNNGYVTALNEMHLPEQEAVMKRHARIA